MIPLTPPLFFHFTLPLSHKSKNNIYQSGNRLQVTKQTKNIFDQSWNQLQVTNTNKEYSILYDDSPFSLSCVDCSDLSVPPPPLAPSPHPRIGFLSSRRSNLSISETKSCNSAKYVKKFAEVGSAIFLGGALSLECYLFFLRPLALDRNDFIFASALSAIPL